jgi:hypothetical protein
MGLRIRDPLRLFQITLVIASACALLFVIGVTVTLHGIGWVLVLFGAIVCVPRMRPLGMGVRDNGTFFIGAALLIGGLLLTRY